MATFKSWQARLLKASKDLNHDRRKQGFLGTISPCPFELIAEITSDVFSRFIKEKDSIKQLPDQSEFVHVPRCIIDMGSGDGRWLHYVSLFALQNQYTCHCVGIEMDQERISLASTHGSTKTQIEALLNTTLTDITISRYSQNIDWICSDFMDVNISHGDLIIIYLSREGNETMLEKFAREFNRTTPVIVIAVGFKVNGCPKNWRLEKTFTAKTSHLKAFKYIVTVTGS